MLTCILGGCGTGKSTRLTEQIRQKLTEGAKVLVLVPEQFSFEAEKKLYAALGAELFNRLQTYSFATLSQDILHNYGTAARNESYASEQEKLLYLYQAVQYCTEQKEFRLFEKRRNAPDFIMSLSEMITKLRKAGIKAETLLEVSPALPERLGDKTHDLSRILSAYDRILAERGRHDSLVNLTEAAGIADTQYYFEGCHMFIDEFDSFTGDQYQMLEVILRQAESVTCAIRADDPAQKPTGIFLGGNNTYQQLRTIEKELNGKPAQVQYCKENLRAVHADVRAAALRNGKAEYEGHVHILEAADPVMETEFICAEICRLLHENKALCCRDIAIAVKEPAVYFPLLERAMERYQLPYDLSAARSVLHRDLIRCFLTLLELVSSKTWRTEAILRYLKSPLSGFGMEKVSMLEHFCFTWGIDKDDWTKPFWQEKSPELEQRTKGFWGSKLEAIRARLTEEIGALRKACQGSSVRKVCMALYEYLIKIRKRCIRKDIPKETLTETVMLWNLLMDTMDTVVECFGDQVLPMETLREHFLLLLRNSSFSTPPQTLDSIRIVDAQTARLDSPKIVFAPGVSEGVFPGEVKAGGMFSQQELRELEKRHIRISRLLPELHSDELLIISRTLSAPREQLYLTYPLVDAAYHKAEPAGVILQLQQMFPRDCSLRRKGSDIPLYFYVRTLEAGYFHYVRHLREDTPELAALRTLLGRDPAYASRLTKLTAARDLPEPSVSPATMQLLLGPKIILSPSGIEQLGNCAFKYFCQYILHLYVPEQNSLTPRSGGDFAHYCLEQILRSMSREQFLALTREQLQAEISRLSEVFSGNYFSDAVRRDSRFQFNYRVVGRSLVQLLEHMQSEMAQGQFVPVGFEVQVSEKAEKGGFPPLQFRNGGIICHGGIDRVDICEGDTRLMRIVDYKTGEKALTPEKIADGLDMQMLLYLFALQQSGAYGGALPSGVFYMPSGQPKLKQFQKRGGAPVSREEILRSFYQMKGLLLDSTLESMEPEIRDSALPVMELKNKTGLYSVNDKQMAHLRQHVEDAVCDMADALQAGKIAPAPNLRHNSSPCCYCSFSEICGKAEKEGRECSKDERIAALTEVFGEAGEEESE